MPRTIAPLLLVGLFAFGASPQCALGQASVLKGRGYAVYVDVPGVVTNTYYCDTGWLPPSGGPITESVTDVHVEGVMTAAAMDVASDDDGLRWTGQTRVAVRDAVILPGHAGEIVFAAIESDDDDDECNGDDDTPSVGHIDGLTVGGQVIDVTGRLNQIVLLPGIGTLRLNSLASVDDDDDDECEDDDHDDRAINALHLSLDSGGEVIVGFSYFHFDDECCAVPVDEETWSNVKHVFR